MLDRLAARHVVGLVVPAFDKGGLEQVVFGLYRGYKSLGHDCVVLVENNTSGYMAKRLECPQDVFVFNGNEGLFLHICAVRGITALHYHHSTFLLKTMRDLGVYTLYTLHNVYTWLDHKAFKETADNILAADRIVAVSRFVRDYFCSRVGVSLNRVDVIPNGVDLGTLAPVARVSREALGLPKQAFVFANVASLHRNKHQALIIRAAEILSKRTGDFCVALVGNRGDANYEAEIKTLLASSEARERVYLVPFVSAEFLGSFYRDVVDCVLLPSLQEGCSNVVLEALATDRPMILTDVGNAREAAALSNRVRIVRPAYSDVLALTATKVDELSRLGHASNVHDLVDAMFDAVLEPPMFNTEEKLEKCLRAIDIARMVAHYDNLVSAEALLVA